MSRREALAVREYMAVTSDQFGAVVQELSAHLTRRYPNSPGIGGNLPHEMKIIWATVNHYLSSVLEESDENELLSDPGSDDDFQSPSRVIGLHSDSLRRYVEEAVANLSRSVATAQAG